MLFDNTSLDIKLATHRLPIYSIAQVKTTFLPIWQIIWEGQALCQDIRFQNNRCTFYTTQILETPPIKGTKFCFPTIIRIFFYVIPVATNIFSVETQG